MSRTMDGDMPIARTTPALSNVDAPSLAVITDSSPRVADCGQVGSVFRGFFLSLSSSSPYVCLFCVARARFAGFDGVNSICCWHVRAINGVAAASFPTITIISRSVQAIIILYYLRRWRASGAVHGWARHRAGNYGRRRQGPGQTSHSAAVPGPTRIPDPSVYDS